MRLTKVREKFATKGMALVLWAVLVLAIVADIVWFTRRPDGIRPWLAPQPILSAAALILGFILLTWQLETQHRNTLEATRKQAQDRLKLDIFKEIAERIEATSVPLTELREVPTAFLGELVLRTRSRVASHYQSALQTVSKEASDSVVMLMSIMETYEIAMPEFKAFRRQLADSLRQSQLAFGDFAFLAFPLALPIRIRSLSKMKTSYLDLRGSPKGRLGTSRFSLLISVSPPRPICLGVYSQIIAFLRYLRNLHILHDEGGIGGIHHHKSTHHNPSSRLVVRLSGHRAWTLQPEATS